VLTVPPQRHHVFPSRVPLAYQAHSFSHSVSHLLTKCLSLLHNAGQLVCPFCHLQGRERNHYPGSCGVVLPIKV
jgi:hypothetical protein